MAGLINLGGQTAENGCKSDTKTPEMHERQFRLVWAVSFRSNSQKERVDLKMLRPEFSEKNFTMRFPMEPAIRKHKSQLSNRTFLQIAHPQATKEMSWFRQMHTKQQAA
jgi:hypothetical protein